jgi:hypothetical protein
MAWGHRFQNSCPRLSLARVALAQLVPSANSFSCSRGQLIHLQAVFPIALWHVESQLESGKVREKQMDDFLTVTGTRERNAGTV